MDRISLVSAPLAVLLLAGAASCSLVNAPDDVKELGSGGAGGAGVGPGGGNPGGNGPGGAGGTGGGTGGAGGTGAAGGAGGAGGGCTGDNECGQLDTQCTAGVCNLATGECEVVFHPSDTACGDPAAAPCSAPDHCDGAGSCVSADLTDGSACSACAGGTCACSGAVCVNCAPATSNSFAALSSVDGWQLTGSWRLYTEAPPNKNDPNPIPFGTRVFGTDGNRSLPYPGGEAEASSAISRSGVIPSTLQFLSWNVDEGGSSYDTKTVSVSVDGGASWTVLVDCNGGSTLPFCVGTQDRPANAWDLIQIDASAFAGQVGMVRFTYDTMDSCCEFERGWFIDVTSFGTTCACAGDADCTTLTDACASGTCDPGTGECAIIPQPPGIGCGDATMDTCTTPDSCDGAGFCGGNHLNGGTCDQCALGAGQCDICTVGVCLDCMNIPPINTFDIPDSIANWELTGGWGLYSAAPPSLVNPAAVPFASQVFGTDGNRVPPYPGMELENSYMRTQARVIPPTLSFLSWNEDEGTTDRKRISISVDGGATWTVLADCNDGPLQDLPFCLFVQNRAADAWDLVEIDTAAFAGQVGIIEIQYNTQDACCDFERGWFLDDTNFGLPCQ